MFVDVEVNFPKLTLDHRVMNAAMLRLTDQIEASMVNYVKLALLAYSKLATGDTLKSIRPKFISNRNLAPLGVAATGQWRRQIVGDYGLKFIISGRRPGAKMPVRLVRGSFEASGKGSQYRGLGGRYAKVQGKGSSRYAVGKRGGRQFEPVPAMLRWFVALNIPKKAWFPIMRAIARRGIKPINIGQKAVADARPIIATYTREAAFEIASRIVRVNGN